MNYRPGNTGIQVPGEISDTLYSSLGHAMKTGKITSSQFTDAVGWLSRLDHEPEWTNAKLTEFLVTECSFSQESAQYEVSHLLPGEYMIVTGRDMVAYKIICDDDGDIAVTDNFR